MPHLTFNKCIVRVVMKWRSKLKISHGEERDTNKYGGGSPLSFIYCFLPYKGKEWNLLAAAQEPSLWMPLPSGFFFFSFFSKGRESPSDTFESISENRHLSSRFYQKCQTMEVTIFFYFYFFISFPWPTTTDLPQPKSLRFFNTPISNFNFYFI